jgi:hypothetical protein
MAAPLEINDNQVVFATAKTSFAECECVAHEVKRELRFN